MITHILIACLLLFVNAFFVAAEFGMVKLRQTQVNRIQEMYGIRGRVLFKIHGQLDSYLSACQLGITLSSLGLGWVGEPAFAYLFDPLLQLIGIISPQAIKIIAFSMAFSFLSFLHIVIGELMPKSLAIRQPESVSLWTSLPLYGFYWLMFPAIWLLNNCSNFMLNITGLGSTHHTQHFYSTEEIKLILTASHLHGELTQEETKIIKHTLDFADLSVTEIMRPKEEIIMLYTNEPVSQLLQKIIKYRYSRYPVYDDAKDEVIGIIHIKDFFFALYQNQELIDLKALARPILKVSYRLPTLNLLRKFRTGTSHFALVYRKKEILTGFVTLDNLLHIILGRIKDEFHKTMVDWRENPDGTLTIKGDCSIYSLERALDQDIEFTEDEKVNTITGLIFNKLHAFPKEGDRIEFEGFDAVIEKNQGAKIVTIRIYPKKA
ncbi:MAG TPA: hemolysin family protein [Gammaproteobacteria bacterium]|nr:hemolysin family protein [Gammaproteobacteria bacterium]